MFVPGGQTFLTHRRGEGKHVYIEGVTNIFTLGEGGQTCYVRAGGAYDDVDEEMVVSAANFLGSRANNFVRPVGP